jgi:hypothetical protein
MSLSEADSTKLKPDFTVGIRLGIIPQRSVFGAELDIIYSRQGTSMKQGFDTDGNKVKHMMKSSYINVPLLFNFYVRKWGEAEDEAELLRFRIGPQIGFCFRGSDIYSVAGRQKKQYITPWDPAAFHRVDYGITAAASFWYIEVRFYLGLSNVLEGEGTSTNQVISILWSDLW